MYDVLAAIDLTKERPDIAYGWIVELFPMSGTSPYGQAFATFSGMLTFLGALFLAYHVLSGIVMSAYSGKVLGEKYHQIWAPLRVILGLGLLVPINGGFSSVHYLLRDVVGLAAVNMGNAPIKAYIQAVTEPTAGKIVDITALKGRFVFSDFLDKEVCNAVHRGLNEGTWGNFFGVSDVPEPNSTGVILNVLGDAFKSGMDVPTEHKYLWDYGQCGSISFTMPNVPKDGILEGSGPLYEKFADARAIATKDMIESIRGKINKTALGNYFTTHDVVNMKSGDILKQLRTEQLVPSNIDAFATAEAAKWNKVVADRASDVYSFVMNKNGAALNERINDYGFMAAGGFERALSKASSISVSLANSSPSKTTPTLPDEYGGPYQAALSAVLGSTSLDDAGRGKGALAGSNSSDDPMNTFMAAISPSIAAMKAGAPTSTNDPLGDMITFGHNLLATYESLLLVVVALRAAAHFAVATADGSTFTVANAATLGFGAMLLKGATAAAAEAIDYLSSWFSPVMTTMLLIGIMHAFVLPMLPMMMVFVMGVSWLIMFLEASIAAVLWAFIFIRMDGHEFIDRSQSPGVTLLFNLFLRPAIGMLAFVGGLMLLPKLMNSLTILWDDSFSAQTSPDWLYIVQWLVGMVMYTWMQWHLTLRLFGLIPTIADRVGSWMGFNSHGYNDGQETSAAIGAAVAAGGAGKMLQRRPSSRGGGGGGYSGGGGGGGAGAPAQAAGAQAEAAASRASSSASQASSAASQASSAARANNSQR